MAPQQKQGGHKVTANPSKNRSTKADCPALQATTCEHGTPARLCGRKQNSREKNSRPLVKNVAPFAPHHQESG
eukprot:CAMPEP_0204373694 /NCGR_PEP_ID=MMETSP0469-20131031/48220_1 /ASSEMBLY_ACC=CAM_ASM_000384 /TAXON_ID=2969 /ORGANISM="Oxyrrhis marina" /LENGTH=72 /DNA_ID=CAMNT_0051364207 /DNA_START=21 /DNA_END=236 /DNA_ORIENTATION=+